MPEREPQTKATLGNATERLQIKYRNSRAMKETISAQRLAPVTDFVIVLQAAPTQNERAIKITAQEEPQE